MAGFTLYKLWDYLTMGMIGWIICTTIAIFLVILRAVEDHEGSSGRTTPRRLILLRVIGYTAMFAIAINIYNALGAT